MSHDWGRWVDGKIGRTNLRLRDMTSGSHPFISRWTVVDGVSVCSCRVPDVVIAQAFSRLFFAPDVADQWVVDMIRLADAAMLD